MIERRYGVCRDFAHAAIALCRAFNLPARYVTGHLPDIGYVDPGTPMDFHAYCEVYLGQEWLTFDPRYNVPRIGRVKVAHGSDAVDGAFATIYGEANLTHFEVWAYQVNPQQVSVGDPIDLSKRLDGSQTVRFSASAPFFFFFFFFVIENFFFFFFFLVGFFGGVFFVGAPYFNQKKAPLV